MEKIHQCQPLTEETPVKGGVGSKRVYVCVGGGGTCARSVCSAPFWLHCRPLERVGPSRQKIDDRKRQSGPTSEWQRSALNCALRLLGQSSLPIGCGVISSGFSGNDIVNRQPHWGS